ncbi:MAG TPA: HlyD family efflux transporter periplasmic adaptor subunit [Planctomycetaceae bacterium]|nr:HlyD family efflux transporter periplasmic adaptor subunit [Planctomycetaceae bacterium]
MRRLTIAVLLAGCLCSVGPMMAHGQGTAAKPPERGPLPNANAGDQVLVKREAARLIDPDKYRTHLSLEPYLTVTLAAPFDGVIRQVAQKTNSQVKSQQELVRIDNTLQKLQLTRAQAVFKAATAEQKLADKKDENQAALAQAKLDIAKAELDLAQYNVDQATLRAPIIGEVLKVFVSEGQYVRAGDPIMVVGDVSKLKVDIPVERATVEKDKPFSLKVEQAEAEGRIDAVLPLDPKFNALRDLFESVASAIVMFDNANGKWKAGQTVFVPLIPRHPVVEVPSSAVANLPDGGRRIQILRQSVVRDLPVVLMGPIGSNRLFVSGAFGEGDEVIYETSHTLPDGFVLRSAAATPGTGTTGTGNTGATGTPKTGGAGF